MSRRPATFRPAGLGPKVERDRQADRERDAAKPYRRWYKTKEWQRLRWSVLLRDRFTCQMCGHIEPATSQLVADHRQRHRGVAALFWDAGNLWTLCKPCHDGAKQRIERAASADWRG